MADFAYDAAAIGRVLAQEGNFSVGARCAGPKASPASTGCWCCSPTARCGAGWRLFQIDRGGPSVIEPAPASVAAPGI